MGQFRRYPAAYLRTETAESDLTYFVGHQIGVIRKSIEALGDYVDAKAAEAKETEEALRTLPNLNHRQLKLLSHALRHPGFAYTVRSHEMSHGVVTNTARADLADLADRGLLVRTRRGRRFEFIAPRDLPDRLDPGSK